MFKVYALEPEAVTEWRDERWFFQKLGWEQGRVIAKFPSDWVALVKSCIQSLESDSDKNRLSSYLIDALKPLLYGGHGASWRQGEWIDNARRERLDGRFDGLLSRSESRVADACWILSDLRANPPLWADKNDCVVSRQAAAIMGTCVTLLRCSREIDVIDPYLFNHADLTRYRPLFQTLIQCATQGDGCSPLSSLRVHTCANNYSPQRLLDALRNTSFHQGLQIPNGLYVRIDIWNSGGAVESPHARYLLTELAGIRVDAGFDEHRRATTDISRVSSEVRLRRLEQFRSDGHPYRHRGAVEFDGGGNYRLASL